MGSKSTTELPRGLGLLCLCVVVVFGIHNISIPYAYRHHAIPSTRHCVITSMRHHLIAFIHTKSMPCPDHAIVFIFCFLRSVVRPSSSVRRPSVVRRRPSVAIRRPLLRGNGCVGLCCVGLCWVVLGCVGMCWFVLGWVVLGCVGL